MIERIEWEEHIGELRSPFVRGPGERPLRLTLHSQSLVDLTDDEDLRLHALEQAKTALRPQVVPQVRFQKTTFGSVLARVRRLIPDLDSSQV